MGVYVDTVEWLKKFISFNTTSYLSNLELIHYVANFLEQENIQFFLNYNDNKDKANLFATFPDARGGVENGFILSGHSDTVPVTDQLWNTDPFDAIIKENRVYGRGSADMKGFLASVLSHTSLLKNTALAQPVHIAISYDEEVGCLGVSNLLEELKKTSIKPRYCMIGEPTSMKLAVAHKGHYTFVCELHGKAAHSSLTPYGVNAIEYAAQLICYLEKVANHFKTDQKDGAFDIPFSTLNIAKITGGTAINIIPSDCKIEFDFRNLPGVSVQSVMTMVTNYLENHILPDMRKIYAESSYTCQILDGTPAMPEANDPYLIHLVKKILENETQEKVAFATEGGYFVQYGIPAVICGPGDIQQAHRPNEYIELSQLNRCDQFIEKLINELAG